MDYRMTKYLLMFSYKLPYVIYVRVTASVYILSIRVGCSALLYLGSPAYIEPIKDIETPRVYVKEATT